MLLLFIHWTHYDNENNKKGINTKVVELLAQHIHLTFQREWKVHIQKRSVKEQRRHLYKCIMIIITSAFLTRSANLFIPRRNPAGFELCSLTYFLLASHIA